MNRRQFLAGAGAAAISTAALVTPGVSQAAAEAKDPHWGVVKDLRRCIG